MRRRPPSESTEATGRWVKQIPQADLFGPGGQHRQCNSHERQHCCNCGDYDQRTRSRNRQADQPVSNAGLCWERINCPEPRKGRHRKNHARPRRPHPPPCMTVRGFEIGKPTVQKQYGNPTRENGQEQPYVHCLEGSPRDLHCISADSQLGHNRQDQQNEQSAPDMNSEPEQKPVHHRAPSQALSFFHATSYARAASFLSDSDFACRRLVKA